MKILEGRLVLFFLVCSLCLLLGCEVDGDDVPLDGDYSSTKSGFIFAGEAGERLVVQDYGDLPVYMIAGSNQERWRFMLDSLVGEFIEFNGLAVTSSTYQYSRASISGSPTIQFTEDVLQDSMWRCEDWPIDSSSGSIVLYNRLSGITCNGTSLHFEGIETRNRPLTYNVGQRIDASLPWGDHDATFWNSSSSLQTEISPNGAYVYITTVNRYSFWNDSIPRYLGFRWWSQGRYHYGYLKLAINAGTMMIYGVGYER